MIYREPLKCNVCGHCNGFILNLSPCDNFVGDPGGKYPEKCESCRESIPNISKEAVEQIRKTLSNIDLNGVFGLDSNDK